MNKVTTVLGPVHPEEVGHTAIHEHIIWRPDGSRDASAPGTRAIEFHQNQLIDFRLRGGRTVVDVSPFVPDRDLDLLTLLARSTAMNVVLCSRSGGAQPDAPGSLEQRLIRECSYGFGPASVRAGMILLDARHAWSADAAVATLRAVAQAATESGTAVQVIGDAEPVTVIENLVANGLEPGRVVFAHRDLSPNPDTDAALADLGACLAFDHVGVEPVWKPELTDTSDDDRVSLVRRLVDAGHTDRVLLSSDQNCPDIDAHRRPLNSVGQLLRRFVPRLLEAGIAQEAIDSMMVDNPKRLLTIA